MIIITAPNKKETKWKISFGGTPSKKNSASVVYGLLERRINRVLASCFNKKTSVKVIYDQRLDYTNETEKSTNAKYLLRLTAQFLEDYVNKDWLSQKEAKYRDIPVL